MKGENPFTLTFGQKPVEFISRTDQIGKIINTFDMENPSNMVYLYLFMFICIFHVYLCLF